MAKQRVMYGYDSGKKIIGQKYHLLVDTMGLHLVIVSHAVSTQGRDRTDLVLEKILHYFYI